MVIISELKLKRTLKDIQSLVAHHRPSLEIESYTEEPVTLAPGETHDISVEKGITLISNSQFTLSGDVNLTVDKFFTCYSPLSMVLSNEPSNTSNLTVRIYKFS